MKSKFSCKIFYQRLMSEIPLEEQINDFFQENKEIEIVYMLKEEDTFTLIYKEKIIKK